MFYILPALLLVLASSAYEFADFETLVRKNYLNRKAPNLASLGRQADPCRVQAMTGMGRLGSALPNSAYKAISELKVNADRFAKKKAHSSLERLRTTCIAALKSSKTPDINILICSAALDSYRRRRAASSARSSGSAWDELFSDLGEQLTEDEILDGLGMMAYGKLGFVIDNTGSMSNDIKQVTQVIKNLIDASYAFDVESFVIMSYNDPDFEDPTNYYDPEHAQRHLEERIVASMGGDCPEKTCTALGEILGYHAFMRGSPIFVFTDASSNDCSEDDVEDIENLGIDFGHSYHFVLTGTCPNEGVDGNYTRLARYSEGSIYRVSDNQIFDLKDIIADTVEGSSIIAAGDYDDFYPDDGKMRRKKRSYGGLAVYIDETVGKLTLEVTFHDVADPAALRNVQFAPKYRCIDTSLESTRFGNVVYYKVDCPCIGEWQLSIPNSINNKWNFIAKTLGEHSISFDVFFEQGANSTNSVSEANDPCLGELTMVWVVFHQHESINEKQPVVIILLPEGGTVEDRERLIQDKNDSSLWFHNITVPTTLFTVAIRGKTKEGNLFLRLLNRKIQPHSTCLRIRSIVDHITIRPGGEVTVVMSVRAKIEPKLYSIYCMVIGGEYGFKVDIFSPKNPYLYIQRLNRDYYLYVKVTASREVTTGRHVKVKCYAKSDVEKVYRIFSLMVL